MKYIKMFEILVRKDEFWKNTSDDQLSNSFLDKYKFKLGDYVYVKIKLTGVRWEKDTIFQITAIETSKDDCYFLEPIYTYFSENELELVPEYVLDANKYNL